MVEELDQDLDLDGGDGDAAAKDTDKAAGAEEEEEKKDKPAITSVGLKENIKNVNAKADDDDEVQMEDPSEDVKDEDEKQTNEANDSSATKLAGAQLAAEEEKQGPKKHYTLIDSLSQFLYEDEDPLPILTGYFLKVMEQLLDKQKQSTLEYLLLH